MQREPARRYFRLLCWLTGIAGWLAWLAMLLPLLHLNANGFDLLLAWYPGVVITVTLYVLTRLARPNPHASLDLANGGLIALVVGMGLGLLLIQSLNHLHSAAIRMHAASSLRTTAEALADYDEKFGHLPPVAITDAQERPLLSWRVALLPQLGHEDLHNQFRLDEPWDSPHNVKLLPLIPQAYATPGKGLSRPEETFIQAMVGPGTLFEPGRVTSLAEVEHADGLAKTILLVEAGDAVPWTKPADVVLEASGPLPRLGGVTLRMRNGILFRSQPHVRRSVQVVFCDGMTRGFTVPLAGDSPERIAKYWKAFRAFSTWNGGETPDWIAVE